MLDQITALGRSPGPIGNDLPLTLASFADLRRPKSFPHWAASQVQFGNDFHRLHRACFPDFLRPKIIPALGRFPGPIGNDFHRLHRACFPDFLRPKIIITLTHADVTIFSAVLGRCCKADFSLIFARYSPERAVRLISALFPPLLAKVYLCQESRHTI
ncbi:hypothetical protein [Paenibacillus cymbidii]|uniref:hypothetical protein n=1 Tax=Paenibacillus cymbidii TaxID=1639034 RepID=UPI00108069A8|nr:hypothetical protein [Paenibacillus cymbidii]